MSASQVVTELVIDADTSGADRYSDAIDKTASSAQSALGSVGEMTLAIAGVGVAVVGAIEGLRAFVDYAGRQSQALVDIGDHAAIAGMSVKEFQETLFAVSAAGVSEKDVTAGIDKIAADLQQAGRGVTQFGQLFEANDIAIKNQNGQLITTKQAIADIMQLTQNAAPAVQREIANIVGVSASWIPFLKEGADQFAAQKAAAADLGVVIDQATIEKAAEFNAQWKTAVATWDLQFKASIASILPLLTQLATIASQVLNGIGSVTGTLGRWATPDDSKSKSQLTDQIDDAFRLRDALQQLDQMDTQNTLSGGLAAAKSRNLAGLLGLPEDATIAQVDQLVAKLTKLYDGTPARLDVTPSFTTKLSAIGGGGKDDVDRVTDSIDKQIAKMRADAEAAGQGAGELERLRVEAQLYEAAQRDGVTDTEKFADRFADLAEKAGKAADALAHAKLNADIKFGANTAFLSQDDAAIASKLKEIYPDVATALGSAEAAQLKFNSAAKSLSGAIENDLVNGLTDIVSGAKSASQGFSDLAASVVKAVEQMVIKIAIVEPLMKAFQSSLSGSGLLSFLPGGGGGGLPGTAGSSLFGPVAPSAHGNVFNAGHIIPFAAGGVVGSPTIAPMALFGEAGPEAIMPLRRGADGSLGVAAGGANAAPQINVTLIENPNAQGSVTQRSNSNGGIDIEIAIAQIAARSAGTPGGAVNRVLSDQFGASQRLARR